MTTSQKALALCHAIEAAGASEQLTKCSVLASELRLQIQREEHRNRTVITTLNEQGAACFPEVENGQKHFARVVMESCAQDLSETPAA